MGGSEFEGMGDMSGGREKNKVPLKECSFSQGNVSLERKDIDVVTLLRLGIMNEYPLERMSREF